MASIATLASQLGMLAKFVGIVLKEGLSEDFFQRVIDDPAYRARFVAAEKRGFEFLVWRTIELHDLPGPDEYYRSLVDEEETSESADDILLHLLPSVRDPDPHRTEDEDYALNQIINAMDLDLVAMSFEDLGFTRRTRRDEIYRRALSLGLELCPPETGPTLLMQYAVKSSFGRHLIAMEPIEGSDGYPRVFSIECFNGKLRLDTYNGYPDFEWSPGDVWVVSRSKR